MFRERLCRNGGYPMEKWLRIEVSIRFFHCYIVRWIIRYNYGRFGPFIMFVQRIVSQKAVINVVAYIF